MDIAWVNKEPLNDQGATKFLLVFVMRESNVVPKKEKLDLLGREERVVWRIELESIAHVKLEVVVHIGEQPMNATDKVSNPEHQ
jgi:hypothetical protein